MTTTKRPALPLKRVFPRQMACLPALLLVSAGCQLLGQDPARCEQSAATVRQALSFKDFESARKWRDYTWKVCDERAVVATLDKEILDGEAALDAETKANAQAQQLAKQRINAAQSAWYAFDRAKAEEHTPEALDATRKSAKRLEEGLPPAFAEKIAAYNAAQYEKRLAALGR
ncbi:MAG: hypothetical protein ABI895_12435 [Deltaproteobacteria bacterium]